jgi:hypothetical protein
MAGQPANIVNWRIDGIDRGPMHGIPYGLKDIYDTGGIRTTCHSHRWDALGLLVSCRFAISKQIPSAVPLERDDFKHIHIQNS